MPGTPTPNYAIPTLAGTDLARDIDTIVTSIAAAIDSTFPGYSQAVFASRPVSSGGSPGIAGRFFYATDVKKRYQDFGTGWHELGPPSSLVTALPGSPVDGQECYFDTGVAGVIWHLRYRTSETKWAFLGGADLYAETVTPDNTGSTSYADLGGSSGPSIALPLAGDYDVEIGAAMWSGAPSTSARMSYAIGGTAAVDADSLLQQQPGTSVNNVASSAARVRRKTGLTAVTLTAKFKVVGASTMVAQDRWMRVRPVRLG